MSRFERIAERVLTVLGLVAAIPLLVIFIIFFWTVLAIVIKAAWGAA